jgi:hypothetical protein
VAWAALVLGVLGAAVLGRWLAHLEARDEDAQRDSGTTAMGDTAAAAASVAPSDSSPTPEPGLSMEVPGKPLPGQKHSPCDPRWEVVINGGCWFFHATVKPPCGTGEYEWQGGCYFPARLSQRPNSSKQP